MASGHQRLLRSPRRRQLQRFAGGRKKLPKDRHDDDSRREWASITNQPRTLWWRHEAAPSQLISSDSPARPPDQCSPATRTHPLRQ